MKKIEYLIPKMIGAFVLGIVIAMLTSEPSKPSDQGGMNVCVDEKTANLVADSVLSGTESAYFIYNALERKGTCIYTDKKLEVDHLYRRVMTVDGTMEIFKMKPDPSGRVYYMIGDFK